MLYQLLNLTINCYENQQIREAVEYAIKEPFPLKVLINSTDSTQNLITEVCKTRKINNLYYEINLPKLENRENIVLSINSLNEKEAQKFLLFVPPTFTKKIDIISEDKEEYITNSIKFSIKDIGLYDKLFLINKPVFSLKIDESENLININLTDNINEEIKKTFYFFNSKEEKNTIKIINKLGYLDTEKITEEVLISKVLSEIKRIRNHKKRIIINNLNKAIQFVKNLKIRENLKKISRNNEIKSSECFCKKCHIKNNRKICPSSPLECLKYGFNKSFSCYNITKYFFNNCENNNINKKECFNKFYKDINEASNIFQIRVFIQTFLINEFDELCFLDSYFPYDIFRSSFMLNSKSNIKEIKEVELSIENNEEFDSENNNSSETQESENKKPKKSYKTVWISLAVTAGVILICIGGYILTM